jgi:hypothetical protein
MSKYKLYGLDIRGKEHEWSFPVWVDPQYVEEWRADGLHIDEILNTIPEDVKELGLLHLWIWLQDFTNWLGLEMNMIIPLVSLVIVIVAIIIHIL